ncbi:C40 family peptidase [Kitasatospora sp. NPDC049258]|uniref:C40 family peptidase n=1 Tax=Kitasatospora sp. NPDC049258 TaxID=3155394 RepID=UPI0034449D11
MSRRTRWIAAGFLLVVTALVLLAAIAAHAAGLADDQAQAARRAQARCPAGPGSTNTDTARLAKQVRAALAGTSSDVQVPGLSAPAEQIPNAKIIVATGVQLRIPARGQVIALATALQESGLRNLPGGDRDSLGLFQQRPSQGWGTREQILDPPYASTKFYTALTAVNGWEQLPLTVAAQRVQKSGFPDAYAQHENLAAALQQAIAPTLGAAAAAPAAPAPAGWPGPVRPGCATAAGEGFGAIEAGTIPAGYEIPVDAPVAVRTAIRWALGQLGTPYQWGGSCTNPRGTDPAGRCDCSSLVQRAYGVAGVQLSRTTYTQVTEGAPVPTDALRPGDLVFTHGTADRPEHVAMFIGAGLLVQAPHTGDVVRVSRLADQGVVLAVRRMVGE